jgi:hypothetical protein
VVTETGTKEKETASSFITVMSTKKMEANNQQENFEVLELVLKNLAEEQQKVCRMLTENSVMTELISNKLAALMEQVKQIKKEMPQVNLQSIEALIRRDIAARQQREGEQPLKVIRQLQILLFPPQDARLFYKIVFGRWLIWLTVMLAITNLYKWGMHYTDVRQQDNAPQIQHQPNTKPVKQGNCKPNKMVKRNLQVDSGKGSSNF